MPAPTSIIVIRTFAASETGPVETVNGLNGAVNLTAANVPDANDKRYMTEAERTKLTALESTIASQAEAEAGVENTKRMTALRVNQAIAALAGAGGGLGHVTFPANSESAGTIGQISYSDGVLAICTGQVTPNWIFINAFETPA